MEYIEKLKKEIGLIERGCCFGVGTVTTKIHLSNYAEWLAKHKPDRKDKIEVIETAIEALDSPFAPFDENLQRSLCFCLKEFLEELERENKCFT